MPGTAQSNEGDGRRWLRYFQVMVRGVDEQTMLGFVDKVYALARAMNVMSHFHLEPPFYNQKIDELLRVVIDELALMGRPMPKA